MTNEEKTRPLNFPHSIISDSRKKLKVTGVIDVECFDEYEIVLLTTDGKLTVEGSSLHMERLTLDSGEVMVTGQLDVLRYENAPVKKDGFFSRLLS